MGINKRESKILKLVTGLTVAAIAAGLFSFPLRAQGPGLTSAKSKDPIPAKVTEVKPEKKGAYTVAKGQIQKDLILTGELKAAQSIVISAPDIRSSPSMMVTYLAPEGAKIQKGDLIVEFDDSSLMSQRDEAERTLDEKVLNIEKKKMDLEAKKADLLNSISQAESQLEQDELYGKIGKELLPANTYQKYQLNLEKSKLSLEKAKEQYNNFLESYDSEMTLVEISRSQAEINLKQIVGDMAQLKKYAPQDGILIYGDNMVSNRKIQQGDTIFHGMEVASLPDLSSMQVIGYVYDTEYGSITPGTRCDVRFDALPDFKTGGQIVARTNVASRRGFATEQKVFQVTVKLDNMGEQRLKPGMTARIDIPIILAKEAVAIPREYIGTGPEGGHYVIAGSDAKNSREQPIVIGAVGDRVVEIVSGVSPGDSLLPVY